LLTASASALNQLSGLQLSLFFCLFGIADDMESAIGSDDGQLNVVRVGGKYRLGERIGSGSFGV
jgi:hypothetical protein